MSQNGPDRMVRLFGQGDGEALAFSRADDVGVAGATATGGQGGAGQGGIAGGIGAGRRRAFATINCVCNAAQGVGQRLGGARRQAFAASSSGQISQSLGRAGVVQGDNAGGARPFKVRGAWRGDAQKQRGG